MQKVKEDMSFTMTAEQKKRIIDGTEGLERAKHAAKVMKDLGRDTSKLEQKILWVEKVRDMLLKEFVV